MRNSSSTPTHWMKVGLAILPGLFALGISGLPWSLFTASIAILAQGGLILLCIVLIIAGFVRERRIAVWSFPALGILLFPPSPPFQLSPVKRSRTDSLGKSLEVTGVVGAGFVCHGQCPW